MNSPEYRLRRFTPVQRAFHFGLILLFMTLSVTGLAWMFVEAPWGLAITEAFGGYANTILIHRISGLVMLAGFVAQVVYLLWLIRWRRLRESLFGPDSLVYHWRDIKEFFLHFGWLIGLSRDPRFERWSWWGKFDYWAVWWGLIIVGVTGVLIYDPILSSDYLPGWLYNIAFWVHRIEALLAMGHVFTVHFFVEHFRPRNFPFSNCMFDGGMTVAHARSEHPAWVERLEKNGGLQAHLHPVPSLPIRILHVTFGFSMIGLGVVLLIAVVGHFSWLTFARF